MTSSDGDLKTMLTRRGFALGAGMFGLSGVLPAVAGDEEEKPLLRFGLVADVHSGSLPSTPPPGEVRAFRESPRKLREFVDAMNAHKVDFVVELGDFAECHPTQEATVAALDEIEREFVRFEGPRYHVLGNHDLQGLPREVFLEHAPNTGTAKGKPYYAFMAKGFTFVVLDHGYYADGTAMVPGRTAWTKGHLSPAERTWLDKTIAAAPGKVIVFSHWRLDPETGVEPGLHARDAAETRALFERGAVKSSWHEKEPKVIASFSGHHHDGCFNLLNGIGYYGLRAMCMGSGAEQSGYAEVAICASGRVMVTGFRKARSVCW